MYLFWDCCIFIQLVTRFQCCRVYVYFHCITYLFSLYNIQLIIIIIIILSADSTDSSLYVPISHCSWSILLTAPRADECKFLLVN